MSELHIPATNTQAREFGLDLNGDRVVDNQLGMVFSTLDNMGLGVDGMARESLLRGGIIMLADLQTPSFADARAAGITTYLGRDPVPAPCLDPSQLATCGQHLLGTGQFTVEEGSASDTGIAPVDDGVVLASIDRLPVKIALVNPTMPIQVVLHAARVRMTAISASAASATIGGGITKADVDDVVIPEAAAQIDRIVRDACSGAPCACPDGSGARTLQGYFDTNDDCEITLAEVANASVVQSLVSPDVMVDGEALLSFGVGLELAAATFPP